VLVEQSVGPHRDYNLVRYRSLFYAVPQLLGPVRWGHDDVAAMEGVITAPTLETLKARLSRETSADPEAGTATLIEQGVGPLRRYNIVRYGPLFYAIPQRRGAVRWGQDDVAAMEGVITAPTLEELKTKLR
jgi:hypothetical protein